LTLPQSRSDLLAHWKIEYRPKRKLFYLLIEIIVGLALGWVPGVDNFSHLGGFAVGLLWSLILLPIIHPTRTHKWVFIVLRMLAFPLLIVVFVVLVRNFYTTDSNSACSWCRYLCVSFPFSSFCPTLTSFSPFAAAGVAGQQVAITYAHFAASIFTPLTSFPPQHCKGTGLSTYSTSSLHLPEVFSILFTTLILPLF
jgi:uncharacterized membrane protein